MGRLSVTSAVSPQVSMAHSSATGPVRPVVAISIARATSNEASAGDRIRSACFVMWRNRPRWSWISCRCPCPWSIAKDGI